MNCKPGDLAMYVGMHQEHRGSIVRVLRQAELGPDEVRRAVDRVYWRVEPKLGGRVKCADSALRPLRDPGEDARDETLSWLPVPTKELA